MNNKDRKARTNRIGRCEESDKMLKNGNAPEPSGIN